MITLVTFIMIGPFICPYFSGNIPALTRLLQAYVKRGSKHIVADGKLVRFFKCIIFYTWIDHVSNEEVLATAETK